MSVETVIFDLGKVLLDFDYSIAAQKLAERCGRKKHEIRAIIEQSPLLLQYESAEIDSQLFYKTFCAASGYCDSFDEFAGSFGAIFSEIAPMVAFNEELRAKGVPTYVLSNTNEIAIGHVRRTFPFYANFTDHILSYEQRAMKPGRRIYEAAEQMCGKRGKQIVFIDDRLENVEGAAALGWHTVHHHSPAETIPIVRSLLQ